MNTAHVVSAMPGHIPSASVSAVEGIYAAAHWLLSNDRIRDAARVFRLLVVASPDDERGWVGLGECHERASQWHVALELYGAGAAAASGRPLRSVRCLLGRARVLEKLGMDYDAVLDAATNAASHAGDESEELTALVDRERQRLT